MATETVDLSVCGDILLFKFCNTDEFVIDAEIPSKRYFQLLLEIYCYLFFQVKIEVTTA